MLPNLAENHPSNFRTRNTSILRQIPVLNSLVSHDRGGTGPELSPSPSRPVNSSAHRGGHVATESRSGRPALFLYNWTTRREQEGDSLSSGYLRALDSAAFIFDVPYMFFLIVFLSKVQNAVRAKTTGSDQRSRLKNLKLQHFALFNENFEKLFRGRLRVHARNEAEGKKHCVPFWFWLQQVASRQPRTDVPMFGFLLAIPDPTCPP